MVAHIPLIPTYVRQRQKNQEPKVIFSYLFSLKPANATQFDPVSKTNKWIQFHLSTTKTDGGLIQGSDWCSGSLHQAAPFGASLFSTLLVTGTHKHFGSQAPWSPFVLSFLLCSFSYTQSTLVSIAQDLLRGIWIPCIRVYHSRCSVLLLDSGMIWMSNVPPQDPSVWHVVPSVGQCFGGL